MAARGSAGIGGSCELSPARTHATTVPWYPALGRVRPFVVVGEARPSSSAKFNGGRDREAEARKKWGRRGRGSRKDT